jgi:hypothetical protein
MAGAKKTGVPPRLNQIGKHSKNRGRGTASASIPEAILIELILARHVVGLPAGGPSVGLGVPSGDLAGRGGVRVNARRCAVCLAAAEAPCTPSSKAAASTMMLCLLIVISYLTDRRVVACLPLG